MNKLLFIISSTLLISCASKKDFAEQATPIKTTYNTQTPSNAYPVRLLFGLEPAVFNSTTFRINAGSVTTWNGSDLLQFNATTDVNLLQIGLNGADRPLTFTECYIYVIKNYLTLEQGFIASPARFNSDLVLPEGFSIIRKLPFGVMLNPIDFSIPPIHLSSWPLPFIRFTDAESTVDYNVLANASDLNWTQVQTAHIIPDNARMAYINIQLRHNGVGACSSYIRTYGQQSTGILVGSLDNSTHYINHSIFIRVDSLRRFEYKSNTSACKLYIYILGYEMTEQP